MSDIKIDTDQLEQASKNLETSTSKPADTSVRQAAALSIYQSPSKWGTEEGPVAFQSRFIDYLHFLEHELAIMRDQLDDFVAATDATVKAVKENEDNTQDAANNLTNTVNGLRERTNDEGTSPDVKGDKKADTSESDTSPGPATARGIPQKSR